MIAEEAMTLCEWLARDMNAKRERNKEIMESILCGLLGALSVALGMYIGFYMSKSKAKEKDEILQNKERKDICRLLNNRKDILVRYKNCETSSYYAHVVTHKDTNEYIMIDLD